MTMTITTEDTMPSHFPTTSFEIRAATIADLPRIERLLTTSDLPLDGVAESLSGFLVAESGADESAIIGVAGLEACGGVPCRNALLRSVAVAEEWRSRGVGRALVERLIADAEARGIRALYLLTLTAERYFPSFGFRHTTRDAVPDEVRATSEFESACPASATVMSRMIPVAQRVTDAAE
jgi:amino-acid N-acetyltransferase